MCSVSAVAGVQITCDRISCCAVAMATREVGAARRPASVGAARVLRSGVSYMQWQCVPYDGDQLVPVDWDLDLNLELTAGPRTKLHRYLSEGHNDLFRTMHPPRRSSTMTLHDRSTTLYLSLRQIKRYNFVCIKFSDGHIQLYHLT